jgi:hypothetical protein
VRPAVEAELAGIPAVVIVTTGFPVLAGLSAKAGGVTNLRIAEYPGPVGIHDPEVISKNVREVLFNGILNALMRPDDSNSARAATGKWDARKVIYSGTFEQVNQFFADREWTDGLPIIPPTMDKLEQFLRFTERSPDEEIAILQSANLKAVPWNIAANAVMAGCRPEHMPLLIAAVEALGDDRCSLNNIGSTSGLLPYVLINGPVIRDLGIECSGQLISRGANPAIGRAIGLIVRNIAGFRPGETYMGTFGYPLVFTLAEDEAASPWAPFHVDQGYSRDTSTVTIGVTCNWGPCPEASSTPDQSGATTALELLRKAIPKMARLYDFPTSGPKAEKSMVTLLMSPPVARSLSDAGYSKEDVRRYVYENARMPLREFEWITKYTFPSRVTVREKAEEGILPKEFLGSPDDMVRILSGPEMVHLIVCGDSNRNRVMAFEGGHTQPTTRPIRFPRTPTTLSNDGQT